MTKSRGVRVRRQVTETTRECRSCKVVKDVGEFYSFLRKDRPSRPARRYYFSYCKPCQAERTRQGLYGVTLAEIVSRQGGSSCPLCRKRKVTCVDHDHQTGRVRGALCQKCNLVMAYMDDRGWVARAEAYRAGEK